MHEENYTLYLTVVDGRVHDIDEIENVTIAVVDGRALRLKDFARVERRPEPVFNIVTADGVNAVLLNIRSQPDGSTVDIADGVKNVIRSLQRELPPDMKLAFFYDQSLLVRASVQSVWEAILFGLILSVVIIFLFLKNWGATLTAIVVIPVTVLITVVAMRLAGLSFNLMTLGGIAAAIGLVIDDAIVVVEAIKRQDRGRAPPRRGHSVSHQRNLPPARRLHADAGGRVHSAGVPRRGHGRLFPRPGADDGRIADHLAGVGDHAHTIIGGMVHSRASPSRNRRCA